MNEWGKARHGEARLGMVWQGGAWRGQALQAWRGVVRRGKAW